MHQHSRTRSCFEHHLRCAGEIHAEHIVDAVVIGREYVRYRSGERKSLVRIPVEDLFCSCARAVVRNGNADLVVETRRQLCGQHPRHVAALKIEQVMKQFLVVNGGERRIEHFYADGFNIAVDEDIERRFIAQLHAVQ